MTLRKKLGSQRVNATITSMPSIVHIQCTCMSKHLLTRSDNGQGHAEGWGKGRRWSVGLVDPTANNNRVLPMVVWTALSKNAEPLLYKRKQLVNTMYMQKHTCTFCIIICRPFPPPVFESLAVCKNGRGKSERLWCHQVDKGQIATWGAVPDEESQNLSCIVS